MERHFVMSDLHGPYLDKQAWKVALAVLTEHHFDCVWINGDLCDFSQISSHEGRIKYFDHSFDEDITLEEEILIVRNDILKPLRKAVGKSTKIVYRLGNHDRRLMSMAENNT